MDNAPERTPHEWLSSLLSASLAGDIQPPVTELSESEEAVTVAVEARSMVLALRDVAFEDRTARLEIVANYWQAVAGVERCQAGDRSMAGMETISRLYAFHLVTHAAGWRLFCAGRRLTPEAILAVAASLVGTATLAEAEASATCMNVSEGEVLAHHRAIDPRTSTVSTPEIRADQLEVVYQTRLQFWRTVFGG